MSTLSVVRCTLPAAVMSPLALPAIRSATMRTSPAGMGVAVGAVPGATAKVAAGAGAGGPPLSVIGKSALLGGSVAYTGGGAVGVAIAVELGLGLGLGLVLALGTGEGDCVAAGAAAPPAANPELVA